MRPDPARNDEQYLQLFALLGMRVQTHELYLLPFLKERWQADIGLDQDELALLRSISLLVVRK